jgi:putative spermidine/putrescine transport system substrate-binding protein
MVNDFGAFPSIEISQLPDDVNDKLKDAVSKSMPSFPGGQWSAALNEGWYTNVAGQAANG